jgi:hypothetical protein
MRRKDFRFTVVALVAAVSLAAGKMRAARTAGQDDGLAIRAIPAGSVRYGPYSTGAHAHQMAAYFQRHGYPARILWCNVQPERYYVDIAVQTIPA